MRNHVYDPSDYVAFATAVPKCYRNGASEWSEDIVMLPAWGIRVGYDRHAKLDYKITSLGETFEAKLSAEKPDAGGRAHAALEAYPSRYATVSSSTVDACPAADAASGGAGSGY
jgi:hypothetical protein